MSTILTCIAIDDDHLFLKKIEEYLDNNSKIKLLQTFDNPIKGATAIMTLKPDVVLLDFKMPYMDGQSLIDWITPKISEMEDPPAFIIISSFQLSETDLLHSHGFINKSDINDPDFFNNKLISFFTN